MWALVLEAGDASFGVRTNQFGFNISGSNNLIIVMEACTNLANPIWSAVGTNPLPTGVASFLDPQWTNYPARFYRAVGVHTNALGITRQPQSQLVAVGTNVTFSVLATGTPSLAYQWCKDGTNLSGATGNTYAITNVQTIQTGNYTVVVGNVTGSMTSSVAVLTVDVPPSLTEQPHSQSVTVGANVTFSVVATGMPSVVFQWCRDGTNLSGQTSSSFSIGNVQTSDGGNYTVVISNELCSVTSSVALLNVSALIPSGSFQMGDTFNEGSADELPLHSVSVSAFYMDARVVTKALRTPSRTAGPTTTAPTATPTTSARRVATIQVSHLADLTPLRQVFLHRTAMDSTTWQETYCNAVGIGMDPMGRTHKVILVDRRPAQAACFAGAVLGTTHLSAGVLSVTQPCRTAGAIILGSASSTLPTRREHKEKCLNTVSLIAAAGG